MEQSLLEDKDEIYIYRPNRSVTLTNVNFLDAILKRDASMFRMYLNVKS